MTLNKRTKTTNQIVKCFIKFKPDEKTKTSTTCLQACAADRLVHPTTELKYWCRMGHNIKENNFTVWL